MTKYNNKSLLFILWTSIYCISEILIPCVSLSTSSKYLSDNILLKKFWNLVGYLSSFPAIFIRLTYNSNRSYINNFRNTRLILPRYVHSNNRFRLHFRKLICLSPGTVCQCIFAFNHFVAIFIDCAKNCNRFKFNSIYRYL